jgi:hypothetical protein
MHHVLRGSIAAIAGLILLSSPVHARRIAIPPLPDRLAKSAAIVVGKVTSIETKTVKTPQGEMAVAVFKVEAGSGDTRGLTHIKVAFQSQQLMNGEEYCLMLSKGKDQDHYTVPQFWDRIGKRDGNYEAQAAIVKKAITFLEDPKKGFQSKDAGDRLLTAALLLGKYRPWGQGSQKQEAIDAAESKMILEALAEADWQKFDALTQLNGQQLFARLGLTAADGWTPPMNFQQMGPAAKEWLKANAGKYRVKRFVTEK